MTTYTSRSVYEFVSKQTNDPIVEWKTCRVSGQPFPIYQSDVEFYEKISPTFNGKKYQIPAPTLCPEERERRRMARRNERTLYSKKCDITGQQMVSIYPPESPYKVYYRKYRYSDQWDAMDYGREFDFSKSFFQNFHEMNLQIPKKSLHIVDSLENCDYCNYGIFSKSCYLTIASGRSENCYYSQTPLKSVYDVDGLNNTACQYTYGCSHCIGCYQCSHAYDSDMCKFSSFLSFCKNCDNCLGCVNLYSANYYILNKKYTKEEYEQRAKQILGNRDTLAQFEEEFKKLILSSPKEHLHNVSVENTYANYIQNGKNVQFCYLMLDGSNYKYCAGSGLGTDWIDWCATTNSAYTLETIGMIGYHSAFILTGEHWPDNCYYCQHINACKDCFGCEGIKNKQYCILNKQYTKEEYEELVPQIIEKMKADGEWGEFFPVTESTFGYNETLAQRFHPMEKEEAIARGYKRQDSDYHINIPEASEKISWKDLPKTINEVSDDIVDKVILCETTGKPYRIIKQELAFYRQQNIPLPTKHQNQRKKELMTKTMPKEFHLRNCDKCWIEMVAVYAPSYPWKVYCGDCYQQEVYG